MEITNKQISTYCKTENRFQKSVYRRKVAEEKMTQSEMDLNIAIIDRLGRMAEELEKRGLTLDDFAKWVGNQPITKGQSSLF